MEATEDVSDIILENKLLFEQLNDFKTKEKEAVQERQSIATILSDQYYEFRDKPYYEIIYELLHVIIGKTEKCDKAIARAIEKEGEVLTLKASLNSIQQHHNAELSQLQEELRQFKDRSKNENYRHKLSADEQMSMLVQERNVALANENTLTLRLSEVMDEVDRLNEEVTQFKQQNIDLALQNDVANNNILALERELNTIIAEHDKAVFRLETDLTGRQNRCKELEEELVLHEKRNEIQRKELQNSGEDMSQQQVELFQLKAKCKDYKDRNDFLNRQIDTIKEGSQILSEDNRILAEKFVEVTTQYEEKEEELRTLVTNYKYKINELERRIEIEQEKRSTLSLQYDEKVSSIEGMQLQINGIRAELNKVTRQKCDIEIAKRNFESLAEQLQGDKNELLKQVAGEEKGVEQFLEKEGERTLQHELELEEQIKDLKLKLRQSEEHIDTKDGEINLLKIQINELASNLDFLKSQFQNSQDNNRNANLELIESEKNTERLQNHIVELRKDLSDVSVQMELNQDEIISAKTSLCSIDVFHQNEMKRLHHNLSLSDNTDKLKDWISDNNAVLSDFQRKINSLKAEISELQEENSQVKDNYKVCENDRNALTVSVSILQTHLDSSHRELKLAREKILKYEKKFQVQEKRIHGIDFVVAELRNQMKLGKTPKFTISNKDKLEKSFELIKVNIDQLLSPEDSQEMMDREAIIEELSSLKGEISEIRSSHSLLQKERNSLSRKLQQEKDWVDKLRKKEEDLTRALDEKNEQLSSVKHELQLKEKFITDKERSFQKKKGSLEDELKTLKKRYNSAVNGEECGHHQLVVDHKTTLDQLEIAKSTIQYKEEELDKIRKDYKEVETRLQNSNISKLQDEILKLNLANGKLQAQVSSMQGENDENSYQDERNKLLGVISKTKDDVEDNKRKLYQSEIKASALIQNLDEVKSQHEIDRDKYKKDLMEYHDRIATQKEKINSQINEIQVTRSKYLEVKKVKESLEEEVIRLKERVQQIRDAAVLEAEKLLRVENQLERKGEEIAALTANLQSYQSKVSELENTSLSLTSVKTELQQSKATLEMTLSDVNQKYQSEKEKFENIKHKLKDKLRHVKSHYEGDNVTLSRKIDFLEDEINVLKLQVHKESTWRVSNENAYREATVRNRELETTCDAFEEEVRVLKSTLHSLRCDLDTRRAEVRAVTAELLSANQIRNQYETLYNDLRKKKMERNTPRRTPSPGQLASFKPSQIITSTPNKDASCDVLGSDVSKLTLEEEGLHISSDEPFEGGGGIVEEPIEVLEHPPKVVLSEEADDEIQLSKSTSPSPK